MPVSDSGADLLQPVLERGEPVGGKPALADIRARAAAELAALSPRTKRFLNPQPYPVGLDNHVHRRKLELVAQARSQK